MSVNHSTHSKHLAKRMGHFMQRLLSAPFQALPSAFGDQTPPDLKVLEAEVEESRHEVVQTPAPPATRARSGKPIRRKRYL